MELTVEDDVQYLIDAAPRIIRVAGMAAVSIGLSDGARTVLRQAAATIPNEDDWFQALLGYQDGVALMAVVRISLLLDRDPNTISLQNIYQRLKRTEVQDVLILKVHGEDTSLMEMFGPSPRETIQAFLTHYGSLDWAVHSRLTHFRNHGVVHLGHKPNTKSVSFEEIMNFAGLACQMADEFARLCNVSFIKTYPTIAEWSKRGQDALKPAKNDA